MSRFDINMPTGANPVYCTLGLVIISMLGYDILQKEEMIKQHEADMSYIRENVDEIYRNTELANTRAFVIMDTLIRVFHYAKPHKEAAWCCPECSDILEKGRPNKNMPGERSDRPTRPEKPINDKSVPSSSEHVKGKKRT